MLTYRADLRGGFPYIDMPAVGALPDDDAGLFEHLAGIHIFEQGTVALLVLLLYFTHLFKKIGDMVKALFLSHLGKLGIHVGPLVVFALGSGLQVLCSGADTV